MQGIVIAVITVFIAQWLIKLSMRKAGFNGLTPRTWTFWLIFLGVSAAITMFATSLISVAMITIIGVPIALYLMAAPFLFLLLLGTYLIQRLTGVTGTMGTGVALVATLGLLAVPPYVTNRKLEATAQAQVSGDRDNGTKPQGQVIAVRSSKMMGTSKDTLNCDGFCQRALMNGVAERVLVLEQDLNMALDPSLMVDSFRFQKTASCKPVKLPQGYDPIEIQDERKDWKGKRVDELMQLEIAQGNCLVFETVPLGTADLVLSIGTSKNGANALTAGLSLFADTVKADRIAMHEKQGNAFVETYRKTFVTTHMLAPLYAPSAEGGSELRMYPALLRFAEKINIDDKYYEKPDWTAFLVQRLGFDLALRRSEAENETRKVLEDAILRADKEIAAPAPVAANFFASIMTKSKMEAEDFALARQLLEDQRFPVANQAWAAIRYAKGADQDYFDAIGSSMFKRLRTSAAAGTVKAGSGWHEELSSIGSVIAELPRETILKHKADLDWLARQDAVRVQAYNALSRYADFGAESVQPLIWLIDDAQRFRNAGGNDWQHPYLAGITGLCKLGTQGKAAIQPLFDRWDSGVIANWSSYERLAINTLVRMGAEPEDIWLRVQKKGQNTAKDAARERKDFNRIVQKAMKREECGY